MQRLKRQVTISIIALGVLLTPARSQSCNDVRVQLSSEPRGRLQLVQDISRAVQISMVAELPYQEDADIVQPIPGESDLAAYAKRLSTDGRLECVIDNGIIHIFNPDDLSMGENALNHKFDSFSVPSTAELFGIVFRNRLLTEAFRPERLGLISGSEGGGTSNSAEKYRLTSEQLKNITAREVLFRTLRQVPMIYAVEIHREDSHGAEAAWALSNKDMVLSVIPSCSP